MMSGKRKMRVRKNPEINVSAFSDIAFLLIIFFIVATSLQQIQGILAEIPSGEKSEAQVEKTPTIQLVEGRIIFNESEVNPETLTARLSELNLGSQSEDKRIVLLEATGNVPYENYFEVMAGITAAGGITAIVKEDQE